MKNISVSGIQIIVISSFFISLLYSFFYQIPLAVDAKAYHSIAKNIVEGNGFRESASGDILFDRSIQRAGPAYEYFLAGLYSLFGIRLEVVWIMQAILHALTAWLLYKISQLVFLEKGQQIGLIAAALVGFHPDLVEISAMVMTETFYLFLTVSSLYFFVKVFKHEKWYWTVTLSVSLAVGILARPPLILFVPIILFFYFGRKLWLHIVLFLAFLGLCLAPWTIRNYQVYQQFIPTTLIGEYNLWVGNTERADGGQLAGGYNPFDEYAAKYGYVTIHTAASQAFKDFIIEHPGKFVELTAVRTIRYFSLIRPMGFWFYQTGWSQLVFVALSGISIALLFIFGVAGLLKMAKEKNKLFNYLIAFAVSTPLLLLPTVVQSRYRFQIYPIFALAAGYILSEYAHPKTWLKNRFIFFSGLFFAVVVLVDIVLNAEVIISRLRSIL